LGHFYENELPDKICKVPLDQFPNTKIDDKFNITNSFVYFPEKLSLPPSNIQLFVYNHIRDISDTHLVFLDYPLGAVTIPLLGKGNRLINFTCRTFAARIAFQSNCSVVIGQYATSGNCRIEGDNYLLTVGMDTMLSDGILIQTSDQHGILDVDTLSVINNSFSYVHIGRHVWVGRSSIVLKNTSIGDGSIVAAGALLTKSCDKFSIIGGSPNRIIKKNVSWSRNGAAPSNFECRLINQIKK